MGIVCGVPKDDGGGRAQEGFEIACVVGRVGEHVIGVFHAVFDVFEVAGRLIDWLGARLAGVPR